MSVPPTLIRARRRPRQALFLFVFAILAGHVTLVTRGIRDQTPEMRGETAPGARPSSAALINLADPGPPFFPLLRRIARRSWNAKPAEYLPALLCSTAAVALTGLAGALAFGRRVGMFALTVAAFMPVFLFAGALSGSQAGLLFFAALSTVALVAGGGGVWAVVFFAAHAMALGGTFPLLLGQCVAMTALSSGGPAWRENRLTALLAWALTAVLAVMFIAPNPALSGRLIPGWMGSSVHSHVAGPWGAWVRGAYMLSVMMMGPVFPLGRGMPWWSFLGVLFFAEICLWLGAYSLWRSRRERGGRIMFLILPIIVGGVFVVGSGQPLDEAALLFAPGFAVLASLAVWRAWPEKAAFLLGVLFLTVLAAAGASLRGAPTARAERVGPWWAVHGSGTGVDGARRGGKDSAREGGARP